MNGFEWETGGGVAMVGHPGGVTKVKRAHKMKTLLLRPPFRCPPRFVQIGEVVKHLKYGKRSKTNYTKNYCRLLWALRL